jgi:penicillin-binding protein 1A
VAEQASDTLTGVVTSGTGTAAQIGDEGAWGKTGTTENYGDAWFCGGSGDLTTCVWVGYPEGAKSMSTEYQGGPVAGGTYPAEIWGDFMSEVLAIQEARDAEDGVEEDTTITTPPVTPVEPAPPTVEAPAEEPQELKAKQPAEEQPAEQPAAEEPAPQDPGQAEGAPDSAEPPPDSGEAPPPAEGGGQKDE